MREIEFRGRLMDSHIFIYGYLMQSRKRDFFVVGGFPVEMDTIGQYTGLKDKNGVKIFEGDVVKYNSLGVTGRGVIKWYNCRFVMINDDGQVLYIDCQIEFEVIGNIHDNPKLLEEA